MRRVLLVAMCVALVAAGTTQRSVAIFSSSSSSAANVVSSASDFGQLRGIDVQGENAGVLGRVDVGDTLRLTYSRRVDLTSVIDGWNGAAAAVVVHLRDGAVIGGDHKVDDRLEVLHTAGDPASTARVGSVNLGADYLKQGREVTIGGTLSAATAIVAGAQVTVLTLRIDEVLLERDAASARGPAAMVWTPPAGVRDLGGATAGTAPVTEGGALDQDL